MSWWWLLFGPLLVVIGAELIKDLIAYLRVLKYKAQGFQHRYHFFFGKLLLGTKGVPKFPEISMNWKKALSEAGSKPGLVINSFPRGRALIYLTDPTLVHEFLLKDHLVSKKHEADRTKNHYNETFPFKLGPEADHPRDRFFEIFRRGSVEKVVADFAQDIKDHIASLETEAKQAKTEAQGPLIINWKSGTRRLLHTITNTVFFGRSNKIITVESQGNKPFVEAVLQYLEGPFLSTMNNGLNQMFFKLPEKLNLLKSGREATQMRSVLVSMLRTEFLRRKNDPKHVPSWNLIDLKIAATPSTDPVSVETAVEQIFEEICMYAISGMNTTSTSLDGMVYEMGSRPDSPNKFYS